MTELRIDPDIRVWVFLPIVLITFLIEVLRHYLYVLFSGQKSVKLSEIEDSQAISRARLLRENGKYLPEKSFAIRKSFFNDDERGFFKIHQRVAQPQIITNVIQDVLKGNFLNVFPMLIIGGWINVMFSGFVTTKVPFPLTLRFKPMLQAGIELASLDAAWVSSASWYIINIFGLRPIYMLMIGENNIYDPVRAEFDAINGAARDLSAEPQTIFKTEWEALELTEYQNALQDIDEEILQLVLNDN